jgi:predicted metalloprotease
MRARVAVVAFVAVVAAAASALAVPAAGAGQTGNGTAGRTGPRAKAQPSYRVSVETAIADVQAYWADTFPDLYGERYQPVPRDRVIAARPGVRIPRCQGQRLRYRDVSGNAAYCSVSNYIVFDDVGLMPDYYDRFGSFAVGLVFAHEWGHAIQDRAGFFGQVPPVIAELQADCFAGAWTGDVADEPQEVSYRPGDLESAVAALIELRDSPGSSPDDPDAHGSAFDRVGAFQDGFLEGPARCADYIDAPPIIVQIPFSSDDEASTGGNVPADEVIPLTVELLNDFYAQVEPAYRPITLDDISSFDADRPSTIPRCGGTRPDVDVVDNRVYFCIDDEYVAFDEPFLQGVYDDIGDFGVSSLLANPYATHVQIDQGIPGATDNTLEAVLQADCYTGGWVAAVYNGVLPQGSLSAGDLDEFVQAYLLYSRARGITADIPITFVRVSFVRRGFLEGYQSCGYEDISAAVARL